MHYLLNYIYKQEGEVCQIAV